MIIVDNKRPYARYAGGELRAMTNAVFIGKVHFEVAFPPTISPVYHSDTWEKTINCTPYYLTALNRDTVTLLPFPKKRT